MASRLPATGGAISRAGSARARSSGRGRPRPTSARRAPRTMLSPRPEIADSAALDRVRAGGRAAAVADGDHQVAVVEAPGDDDVVDRQRARRGARCCRRARRRRRGRRRRSRPRTPAPRATHGARGGRARPTVPGTAPAGSPAQAQPCMSRPHRVASASLCRHRVSPMLPSNMARARHASVLMTRRAAPGCGPAVRDDRLDAEAQAQVEIVLGVDHPDVDRGGPSRGAAAPAGAARAARRSPVRRSNPALSIPLVTCHETVPSMRSTTSRAGASRCTRVRATPEKLMTRTGEPAPAQPNSSRTSRRAAARRARRSGWGAWSRSPRRPSGRSRAPSPAAGAASAPGCRPGRGPRRPRRGRPTGASTRRRRAR